MITTFVRFSYNPMPLQHRTKKIPQTFKKTTEDGTDPPENKKAHEEKVGAVKEKIRARIVSERWRRNEMFLVRGSALDQQLLNTLTLCSSSWRPCSCSMRFRNASPSSSCALRPRWSEASGSSASLYFSTSKAIHHRVELSSAQKINPISTPAIPHSL